MARSTTSCAGSAPRLSTSVANRRPTVDGNWVPMLSVVRERGSSAMVFDTVVPSSKDTLRLALPASGDVFATSTHVSTAADPPCGLRYIEPSTTDGWAFHPLTTGENSRGAGGGSSPFTQIVRRLVG